MDRMGLACGPLWKLTTLRWKITMVWASMAHGAHGDALRKWTPGTRSCLEMEGQWIDVRENLQETIDFPHEIWDFPVIFTLNQSIEKGTD